MLLETFNKILINIYDTLLDYYVIIDMTLEKYFYTDKTNKFYIIENNKIKTITNLNDYTNSFLIKEDNNKLEIYNDSFKTDSFKKELMVALAIITIKDKDDKILVEEVDITNLINSITIHSNKIIDNKVWIIIINYFIDLINITEPIETISVEYNFILMNGDILNETAFNYFLL
jgi:hypothetical protein